MTRAEVAMVRNAFVSSLLSLSVVAGSLDARADDVVPPADPPSDASGGLVVTEAPSHVHLTAHTTGATLERRTGVTMRSGMITDEVWRSVCVAPCEATLAADARYRVVAPDTIPQDVPRLHGQDADLDADLHGNTSMTVGLALVLAGVGAIGVGTGLLVSESSQSMDLAMSGHPHADVSHVPGIVVLSMSLPLMIVGALVASSGQGSLTVTTHEPTVSLGGGVGLSPEGLVF
jgi:hypothetical protein